MITATNYSKIKPKAVVSFKTYLLDLIKSLASFLPIFYIITYPIFGF